MVQKTSFTYKLSPTERTALTNIIRSGNYRPVHMEYADIAGKTDEYSVVLYKSGKCLIQGKGAADFISFVMEPLVLQRVELGYEDMLNPKAAEAHMGIDESGKGDFFGPIVVAGAYVDKDLIKVMREMNVRDSKNITSDNMALGMGRELRKLLGRRYSTVKIGSMAYNRLYAKMRNVNSILSWGHARAIENVLENVPDCPRAISDQFGSKEQVKRALMKKGQQIKLEQRPRAESDIAVAAASVIAREMFLRALKDLEKKYEMEFPKGASATVQDAAVKLMKAHGPEVLLETAKCHFKTTDVVLAKLNKDRSVLGPEGQIKSKPTVPRRRSKPKSA